MTKVDYIVTNTIIVNKKIVDVVKDDIYRTNGKYCFIYPAFSTIEIIVQAGAIGESLAYAEQSN